MAESSSYIRVRVCIRPRLELLAWHTVIEASWHMPFFVCEVVGALKRFCLVPHWERACIVNRSGILESTVCDMFIILSWRRELREKMTLRGVNVPKGTIFVVPISLLLQNQIKKSCREVFDGGGGTEDENKRSLQH